MIPNKIGRYVIKSELGRGGMSTVYLAHDPNVDRQVAVKLLPREFLHHSTFRERFNREARIIAALEHPAIVPIYDFGQEEGQPFFVMRYMSGGSLSERLKKGTMSIQETLKILERIGSALDHAHNKGIVHRDLKPGNILFDQFGQAYLGDFGIARLQETGATLTGTVYLGTPAYMSPEQVHANTELDGRADIYALGVILFEVLTGRKPFHADTAAGLALKHVTEPVPSVLKAKPDLPPDVERVITRAMAKDPNDRFPTAVELTNAVSSLAAGQVVAPPPDKPVDPMATMLGPTATAAAAATGAVEADAGAVSVKEAVAVPTPTPTPTPIPTPAAEAPPAEPKKRALGGWAIIGIAMVVIICIGAIVAGFLFAGNGDGLFGFLAPATDTPTSTATVEPTDTSEPTETATATATMTRRPTDTATPSPPPTQTPTEEVLAPTLRPTFTPTPLPTATNTRIPPTFTNTPLPTSPPEQPPGGGGSEPPSEPPKPPSRPTEPPSRPTEPSPG